MYITPKVINIKVRIEKIESNLYIDNTCNIKLDSDINGSISISSPYYHCYGESEDCCQ